MKKNTIFLLITSLILAVMPFFTIISKASDTELNVDSESAKDELVFNFAERYGWLGDDYGYGVATDSEDSIYFTGHISGDADLNGDYDIDDEYESGAGFGMYDIFIIKVDKFGTFQWAKRLGGYGFDEGWGIEINQDDEVIVTGYIDGPVDLNGDGDKDDAYETPETYQKYDVFVSVFNKYGDFQWAKRLGGSNFDYGEDVVIDHDNNIILTGAVMYDADLNGDGDTSDPNESGAGYGGYDVYVISMDSTGTVKWTERLGGSVYADFGHGVAVDSNNNVTVTGYITGNADLNGDGDFGDQYENGDFGNGYGAYDIFISSFDPNGTFRWAKRLGADTYEVGWGIAADSNDNVIIVGTASGSADLNGDGDRDDNDEAYGYGGDDIVISAFTNTGTPLWHERLGGGEYDGGWAIEVNSIDEVMVGGYVREVADLNGDGDFDDEEEYILGKHKDAFVSAFDSTTGTHHWVKRFGGINGDYIQHIDVDSHDSVITTGAVYRNADFNNDGDYDDYHETNKGHDYLDAFVLTFSYPQDDINPTVSVDPIKSPRIKPPTKITGTASDDESGINTVKFAYCSLKLRVVRCWDGDSWKFANKKMDMRKKLIWLDTNNATEWINTTPLPTKDDMEPTVGLRRNVYFIAAKAEDNAGNRAFDRVKFWLLHISPGIDIAPISRIRLNKIK